MRYMKYWLVIMSWDTPDNVVMYTITELQLQSSGMFCLSEVWEIFSFIYSAN